MVEGFETDQSGKLNISEVIHLDSVSKENLFLRSKEFFVEYFKSAKDVIQIEDRESGILIGKGASEIVYRGTANLLASTDIQMFFLIKIQSKEGRYRYEIYNVTYQFTVRNSAYNNTTTLSAEELFDKQRYYKKNGNPSEIVEQYKNQTLYILTEIRNAIKNSMSKKNASSKKKDDW